MEAVWYRSYETGVPHTITYPETGLAGLLDEAARTVPEHIALRFFVDPRLPSFACSYRALQEHTERFATALSQLGVGKGDRVAVMLPNCPQFVISFFAVLRLGAIVVNTNPLYVAREMRHQFADSGAETVILLNTLFPRLREIHADTSIKRVIVVDIAEILPWPARMVVHAAQRRSGEHVRVHKQTDIYFFRHLLEKYAPALPAIGVSPEDVALLQYTGGTTGVPKGAMLSHRNLMANTFQLAAWLTKTERGREVILAAVPFFHVYGMTACMLLGTRLGGEVVMLPRPRPVENVLKILQKCRVTIFPGVPTLYASINAHPHVERFDLRSVKFCLSGAAPLPREVAETFERLTGGSLVEGFGMTEASPVTHCNPLLGKRKVGSVGVPLPDTEARVVDLETGEPLPVGAAGELVIRGPQVMKGYWNRPEDSAETLRGGWLHTGDIATMDDEGYFYIVDRKKDMIVASGLKVLPREVEEVLLTHPKVREAVVAGVPDPYRGETVKAFIVLKEGQAATAEEIEAFCRLQLAPFKIPKAIEFRLELPKTMIGKVLRRVLVEEEKAKQALRPPN